jgi:hypothetical protein
VTGDEESVVTQDVSIATGRRANWPEWSGILERPIVASAMIVGTRLIVAVIVERVALGVIPLRGFPLAAPVASAQKPGVGFFSWDAQFYKLIYQSGYPGSQPARTSFFPLYPLVTRFVHAVLALDYDKSALIVSWSALFLAVWAVIRLLNRLLPGRNEGWKAGALLAWFPASAFLVAGYAESLFVATVAGTLLALLYRRPWLACAIAAFGSVGRPEGVALGAAILVWHILEKKSWWRTILAVCLSEAGFIAWSIFLWARFGSPFEEIRVQNLWNRHLTWPLHTLFWSLGQLTGHKLSGPGTTNVTAVFLLDDLCILAALIALGLLVWMSIRVLPAARWMVPFAILVLCLTITNGPFGSSPESAARLIMCIIPLYVPLLMIRSKVLMSSLLMASAGLAVLFQVLFNLGAWFT